MAQRYHIGRNGDVARCNARKGNCPLLGAEHGDFESPREAKRWAEGVNLSRAGGERNLFGVRKKRTPEEQALEVFDGMYVEGVYSEKDLKSIVGQRLGVFPHEIQIGSEVGTYGKLPDSFEVFIPEDGGRVRVYRFDPGKYGLLGDTPEALYPAALISRSEYADRVIQNARDSGVGNAERTLSRAFFNEVDRRGSDFDPNSIVYSVHDGIETRYFDSRLNDVTERLKWENATAQLEGARAQRAQQVSGSKSRSITRDPRLASIDSSRIPNRGAKTVESAKREVRARKPRRTLKWHAEQPITESEAKIFSKVVSVEVVRGLEAKSRAEFLESHGEKVARSPRSMMEAMRKPKLSDGSMIAQANDKGSYFHRSGGEVAAITYDEDGNSTLHFHRGTSVRAKLDEDQDVYYLPTAARVLQTIRTGYGSELRQTL